MWVQREMCVRLLHYILAFDGVVHVVEMQGYHSPGLNAFRASFEDPWYHGVPRKYSRKGCLHGVWCSQPEERKEDMKMSNYL